MLSVVMVEEETITNDIYSIDEGMLYFLEMLMEELTVGRAGSAEMEIGVVVVIYPMGSLDVFTTLEEMAKGLLAEVVSML